MSDWRKAYFNKKSCEGSITKQENGNITVSGTLKDNVKNATVVYWAGSPPNYRSSFSGSGLPYANPQQAFDRSPNVGAVKTTDGTFSFNIYYPNAYYVGLGSLYVSPHVHIKVCQNGKETGYHSIKLSEGIPFRTLTYPAPPSKNPRISPMFYNNTNLPIRTQEDILRDSGYPSHGVANNKIVEVPVPDNFWGLRPAR